MVICVRFTGSVSRAAFITREHVFNVGGGDWTLVKLRCTFLPGHGHTLEIWPYKRDINGTVINILPSAMPTEITGPWDWPRPNFVVPPRESVIISNGAFFDYTAVSQKFSPGEAFLVRVLNDTDPVFGAPRYYDIMAEFSDDPVIIVPVMAR